MKFKKRSNPKIEQREINFDENNWVSGLCVLCFKPFVVVVFFFKEIREGD